jgi:hypothetical protein
MFPRFQIESRNCAWPSTHLDPESWIVSNGNHTLLFEDPGLRLDVLIHPDVVHHSDYIDDFTPQFMLLVLLNIFDSDKVEGPGVNNAIICDLQDLCWSLKDEAEIILNRGVSLIRELNLPSRKEVDIPILDDLVIFISVILEKGCLDLSPVLVHELNVQELTFRFRIFPMPHFMFLGNPSFDPPIIGECAESFNGCVSDLLLCFRFMHTLLWLSVNIFCGPLRTITLWSHFLLLDIFLLLGKMSP